MCSWVGEFARYQLMKMTTALECTSHAFPEIQGSWHHVIRKTGSARWDSFANPFFAVLLNVLLWLFLRKVCRKQTILSLYIYIYIYTQLQGKVVFTFWFCFPLGWRGPGMKELMLRTDNRDDHWSHSVQSCNGMVVNNAPAALFNSIPEKFWKAVRTKSPPKRIAVRFPDQKCSG